MNESRLQYQLNQYVDLYKFHWGLSLKICISFLGISGAISAYVIKNQSIDYMSYALLLPTILCAFGFWLAHRSLPGLDVMRKEAYRLADELSLESYPEFRSIISFVSMLRLMFAITTLGLIFLWFLIRYQS